MFDPQPIQFDAQAGMDTLNRFTQYLRSKITTIIIITVLITVVAFAWRQFSSPQYKAACSFVLEEKSGGVSGIAGLASQFGIDLGAMGGGSANFFSGENISDIITSSTIMDEVLLSKVDEQHTLADLYLDASGMRKGWGWKGRLEQFSFATTSTDQSSLQLRDTTLLVIREQLKKKNLVVDRTTKKGSIYGVQVTSSDPIFAKLFTERLVQTTGELYINIKTRNITSNIQKLEFRADSLQKTFGSRSRQTFAQQILNANEAFKSNLATVEISQRDKSVVFELYAEVMKNLEVSRMLLMNQTPVIQILDRPHQPMVDNRPGFLKTILIASIFGLALSLLLLMLGFMRKP